VSISDILGPIDTHVFDTLLVASFLFSETTFYQVDPKYQILTQCLINEKASSRKRSETWSSYLKSAYRLKSIIKENRKLNKYQRNKGKKEMNVSSKDFK